MKKRIISLALSVLLLLSLIPLQAFTWEIQPYYPNADASYGYNSNVSGETILNDMLNQAAPGSFSDDTLTPYGTQKGEAFTLLEKAEIFEYAADGGVSYDPTFYDNLTTGSSALSDYSTASLVDDTELPALYFAKGVAFDATGSGRRDHVAIVGYRIDVTGVIGPSTWLYVINAETKEVVDSKFLQNSEALSYILANLTIVDSNNLLQITAGDYNGDGKDSLVIYSVTDMYEYTYRKSNCEIIHGHVPGRGSSASYDIISKYLHTEYNYTPLDEIDSEVRNRLCTSLASGDVNGDGIDDLVVISYTAAADGKYVKSTSPDYNFPGTCLPQLSVGYGERDAEKTVADLSIDTEIVSQDNVQTEGARVDTMAYPDIAIGDIDGDGKNEIIAAGYNNAPLKASYNGMQLADDDDEYGHLAFGKYAVAYAYYETSGAGKLHRSGKIRTLAKDDAVSPITMGDSLRETEDLCQQFSVECVALDGLHSKEYVFLSGWFYYMDSNGDLQKISGNASDGNPFKTLTLKIEGTDVDEVYIHSASVGNVFGSDKGEEAITLVVGYKKHTDPNVEGSYYFRQYVFWNGSSSGTGKTVKFATLGDEARPMQKLNNSNSTAFLSGKNNSLSMLLLTVDYGNDSVVAKYSGKAYAYTDPTVVAFLQAAPYFSEMEAGNNSTQYSYSEGYRVSNGTSSEVSYDVGFAEEVELGPISASMDTGFAYELNQEFVDSIDKTYTTTFEANDQNQVILRQTLLYYYAYDIADYNEETGKYEFVENAMVVSAPQYPVLTSLSMDQYNELAAAYNKKVEESTDKNVDKEHKMDLITDELKEKYFLNNEGNPFAYASDASDYTYNGIPGWDLSEASVGGTDTWMKLSYAGGTQTQTYSVTLEEEKTQSVAEGCFVNTTLMAGGGAFGFSAYAGATAGYERLEGSSISTASMTSTETSGTVQNLTSDLSYYGFDWKLIGWKTDDLFAGVPFLGYAVRNQKDLPKAVNDLKAEYNAEDKTVTLTWTAPTADPGRMKITDFYAYDDLHDRYIGVCSASRHSIVIDVSEYDAPGATFTVISYCRDKLVGGVEGMRGMPSNEAYCLFAMSDKEVSALIQDLKDKIDTLTKQDSDFATALADLIKAYQAADSALNSKVDGLEDAQEVLEEAMAEADKLLQEAIDKVNADLSAAIEDLNKATEEEREKAINDLTDAYLSADALLRADIDSLSGKLGDLEQTAKEADDALQTTIEQTQADLTAAKEELESAMAEQVEQLDSKIVTLTSTLDAAYKLEDEILQRDVEELDSKHQEDIEALRSELEELRAQIAQQDEINATQEEAIDVIRIITIVGLCIGSISLLANIVMLLLLLKKKLPKV